MNTHQISFIFSFNFFHSLIFYFLNFLTMYHLFIIIIIYFTILYWFYHTSTWICHGCTCVPNLETPSHLLPHPISLGHPSAPAPSILYLASNIDWRFVSYMILYMFQCHSPKSSHLLPVPQGSQSSLSLITDISVLLPTPLWGICEDCESLRNCSCLFDLFLRSHLVKCI